jgi:hypothetical protein
MQGFRLTPLVPGFAGAVQACVALRVSAFIVDEEEGISEVRVKVDALALISIAVRETYQHTCLSLRQSVAQPSTTPDHILFGQAPTLCFVLRRSAMPPSFV